MILKALYDYYHRSGDLAPEGWAYEEISFVIVISKEGRFVRIEDRRINKKTSQKFLVIKKVGRKGGYYGANVLWDKLEYFFGYIKSSDENVLSEAQKKHKFFVDKCLKIASVYPNIVQFQAVKSFFESKDEIQNVYQDLLWKDIISNSMCFISFLVEEDNTIIACRKELISSSFEDENRKRSAVIENICLITGIKDIPVIVTTATKIPGSQATAKLVSFQTNSGYDSYGKSQGLNAPISKSAEAAFTTSLKTMLSKGSKNMFYVGSRTFLFWSSSSTPATKAVEESFCSLFKIRIDDNEDPNSRIELVRNVFKSVFSGTLYTSKDDKFYILGLAPNEARLAVVYWSETTIKEFAAKILQHFSDMELIDTRKEKRPYYGMYQMMAAVTLDGKQSEVQPNLPEATIKSIFQGVPYPYSLYMACLKRIRAEQGKSQSVTIARAAIIKAYLNRANSNNNVKLKAMVDKENANHGYLCGRLFATLEYIQKSGSGINTIRERYMNAASATPAAVFATLMNLSVHHIEKLPEGRKIYFEKMKSEIVDKLSSDGFPAHLDLQDQGRFMVGYYHQMQEFYTPKKATENV